MPEYVYRAVTNKGLIVKNRVEEPSKHTLVKKLKNNELLPISIVQVGYKSKKPKANKRNMMDIDDIMKQADSANILQGKTSIKPSLKEKVNLALSKRIWASINLSKAAKSTAITKSYTIDLSTSSKVFISLICGRYWYTDGIWDKANIVDFFL